MDCPFCNLDKDRIVDESKFGLVIRDAFPLFPGHTLVIPKRHTPSFFDLDETERNDLLDLIKKSKLQLDEEFHPDSYNIGLNDGPEAGQTIPHLHLHLIPRYKNDCGDPKGGVRWINPDKAKYWNSE